ncbi:hypothetical protein UCDDA912_g04511 [Diaporthe ampelina]|uniref:GrpB domain protein n=1 Tax=Diaporthe ampelina TaxID=1214573 RepID=A0A0G2FM83_9PEZI|nr:hypothetical protein UCDDA912_g04511 [Diaporthe ampelina]
MFPNIPPSAITTTPDVVAPMEMLAKRPGRRGLHVVEHNPAWADDFSDLRSRIRAALGAAALDIHHVGSTSVRGLPARSVIDIDLVVADPADEASYVPALEAAGFTLYFRQPAYYGHRFLGCQTPDTNIHVYGPECPDVARHLIFREWLSGHPGDRDRYAAVKREVAVVAEEKGESGNQYGKRKEWVIREILDRAFRANGLLPDTSNGDARVQ